MSYTGNDSMGDALIDGNKRKQADSQEVLDKTCDVKIALTATKLLEEEGVRELRFFDRLPNEIMTRIFQFCPHWHKTFNARAALWILGQACSHWRQMILNMPQLWTKIRLALGHNRKKFQNPCTPYQMLKTALERTGARKLHVTIYPLYNTPTTLEEEDVLSLLHLTRPRWSSLTLLGDRGEGFHGHIFRVYPEADDSEGFASLATVTARYMDYFEDNGRLLEALEKAPIFHSVTIDNLTREPRFVWANLSHFTIEWFGEDFSLRNLAMCSQLESLVFRVNKVHHPPKGSLQTTICLPTLRKLRVVLCHGKGWNRKKDPFTVCDILDAPGLTQLAVDTVMEVGSHFESIIGMLERSSAPASLKSISICDIFLTDLTVVRLLKATPGVTHLDLTGSYMMPHLFTTIASGTILENLEQLTVRTSPYRKDNFGQHSVRPKFADVTRSAIDNLVESGTPTGTLKSVRVVQMLSTEDITLRPGRTPFSSFFNHKSVPKWVRKLARRKMEEDSTPALFHSLFDEILSCQARSRASCVSRRVLNENIHLFHFALKTIEECTTDLFMDEVLDLLDDEVRLFVFEWPNPLCSLCDFIHLGGDTGDAWMLVKQRLLGLSEKYAPYADWVESTSEEVESNPNYQYS